MNKKGFLNQIDLILDVTTMRDADGKMYSSEEVVRIMTRRLIQLKENINTYCKEWVKLLILDQMQELNLKKV